MNDQTRALGVAPQQPAEEPIRLAYKTGYDEGYSDASDGMVDHDACEEGWQQYREKTLAAAQPPSPPAPSAQDEAPVHASYKRMFEAAVSTLAEIDKLLGVEPDGCNDPDTTLSALKDCITARSGKALRALFAHWNEFGPKCGFGELMDRLQDGAQPPSDEGQAPEGWRFVPVEPTEAMWGELARDLVWFLYSHNPPHYGSKLHRFLENLGRDIPDWLRKEIKDVDHSPAKGTFAVAIYKAMLDAAPAAPPHPPVAEPPIPTLVRVKSDRFEISMNDGRRVTLWRPQSEVGVPEPSADAADDARSAPGTKLLRRMPDAPMVEAGRAAMEPEKFVSHMRALWVWNAMWDAAPAVASADGDYGCAADVGRLSADAVREALAELVALKALKDKIERGVCVVDRYPDGLILRTHKEHAAAMAEYDRRKPLAWAAASVALAASPKDQP